MALLEKRVAARLGFDRVEPVTGQTYSRKFDAQVMACLANIAAGAHKYANDIRLLAGLKEIEEPFESSQVGSSAMAYKRNPMRCERMTGLARYVIAVCGSMYQTAAEQWLERTLDDSAHKRLAVPEAFLATDGILRIALDVSRGLVVYPQVIRARVEAELPFMATEEILMAATASRPAVRGRKARQMTGDRQALHERIRKHAQASAAEVKLHGRPNDLLARLAADPAFSGLDLARALDPHRFVGLAPRQVDDFLAATVRPMIRKYKKVKKLSSDLAV